MSSDGQVSMSVCAVEGRGTPTSTNRSMPRHFPSLRLPDITAEMSHVFSEVLTLSSIPAL